MRDVNVEHMHVGVICNAKFVQSPQTGEITSPMRAIDEVVLRQQKLRQIGAILTGNASDQNTRHEKWVFGPAACKAAPSVGGRK